MVRARVCVGGGLSDGGVLWLYWTMAPRQCLVLGVACQACRVFPSPLGMNLQRSYRETLSTHVDILWKVLVNRPSLIRRLPPTFTSCCASFLRAYATTLTTQIGEEDLGRPHQHVPEHRTP